MSDANKNIVRHFEEIWNQQNRLHATSSWLTTFRRFDLAALPVCARRATGGSARKRPSLTPGQRRWRMARAWHARFTLAGRYSTCWNP